MKLFSPASPLILLFVILFLLACEPESEEDMGWYTTTIFVMNSDGSGKRAITDDEEEDMYPIFSPDGSIVAFLSHRTPAENFYGNNLFTVHISGTNLIQLTTNGAWNHNFTSDGSKVVFEISGDIFVVDIDGSNLINLTNTESVQETSPAISFDDSLIVCETTYGNKEIMLMNIDGTDGRYLPSGNSPNHNPIFSPDGLMILFRRGDLDFETLYQMNIDGTGMEKLTDTRRCYNYEYSSDGSKIVFESESGVAKQIFIMNSDGTEKIKLTDSDRDCYLPSFSPDGSKIVYVSEREGDEDIYIINSDGTGETVLTQNTNWSESHPSFSPDGSMIVFDSYYFEY